MFSSTLKARGFTASAKEVITIDKLHCCLGHISHKRAKLLVKKGLIEGVELKVEDTITVCEACESVKGEWKSVMKVQERDAQ